MHNVQKGTPPGIIKIDPKSKVSKIQFSHYSIIFLLITDMVIFHSFVLYFLNMLLIRFAAGVYAKIVCIEPVPIKMSEYAKSHSLFLNFLSVKTLNQIK